MNKRRKTALLEARKLRNLPVMSRNNLAIMVLAALAVVLSVGTAAWLSQPRPAPPVAAPADSGPDGPLRAEIEARVEALQQRVTKEPEDVEGWKMLGRSYMALGRYREAVEAWSWVKEQEPRDPHAAAALEELAAIARRRGVHKEEKP